MAKYKHIFFDLDHTLWDFNKNSSTAMEIVYDFFQFPILKGVGFLDFYVVYKKHNDAVWADYAKGIISQDDIKLLRFQKVFTHFGINDALKIAEFSKLYTELLPQQTYLFPYCLEALQYVTNKNYTLHILSNGFENVQIQKLTNAKMIHYFKSIITSEKAGFPKPHIGIFEFALKQSGAAKKETIMIGDALDIDIKGALDFGMDCIHVNHLNKELSPLANYTIFELKELMEIL
ncbi:MAG: YjjG family noncanonical pyrimidine nucleotidase [Sediminibacterium sp.]|nr:YjjG family noncanonical pyrimidine nucleotidase [Sediminibacterium sp.]